MWEWYTTGTNCTTATTGTYYYTCATSSTACTQVINAQQYVYYRNAYNTASGGIYAQEDPAVWLERQRRSQARQLDKHEEAAKKRALELLLDNLSPTQRETYEKNKWFVVEGGKSGKQYRIHANDNVAANIDVMDGDQVKLKLCGHCDIVKVPLGDHLLAQKMMLELAEEDFLKIANRHAA